MRDLEQLRRDIGDNLRRTREDKGLSRPAVCRGLTISPSTLYKVEMGRAPNPRLSTLHDLASKLGVDLWEIVRAPDVDDGNPELRSLVRLLQGLKPTVVSDLARSLRSLLKR